MLDPHRNTGAAFARADGSTWAHNAVHVPTDAELSRRRYKLQIAPPLPWETPPEAPPALPVPAEWPLMMSSTMYLKLHPAGPHADLARRCTSPVTDSPALPEEDADGAAHE